MNQTHTAAPWAFDRLQEKIFGSDGESVVYETNTNQADIDLIVAAPDLLVALQNSIALADRNRDAMELLGHKVERPPEMQAVYDACVAAVNKATGLA